MNAVLSPIVSEFETEEQAASYDRWFRAKVLEVDRQGRVRLSIKEAIRDEQGDVAPAAEPAAPAADAAVEKNEE